MAATWWWADDKDGGHQNHWVQYNAATQSLLESAFLAKRPRVDVDGVRFVQINRVNMYQARADAPDRRRMVERRTEDEDSEDDSEDPDDSSPLKQQQQQQQQQQQPVPAAAPAASDVDDDSDGDDSGAPAAKASEASLQGATICLSGKLSDTVANLTSRIVQAGGKVSKSVTNATTHVLCTATDYSKKTNKVILAEAKGIAIVSESFLAACESAGSLVDPAAHSLSPVVPSAAAAKRATPASHKQAIADEVSWYWADDSEHGHQDKWVEYSLTTSRTLERAFKAKETACDVDTERFVHLDPQDLYQARKDAPDRRRTVRRGDGDQQDDNYNDDDDDSDILDSAHEHDNSDGSDSGGGTQAAGTSSSDDVAQVIKWFWAGDSATGSQDNWVEYDSAASASFEAAMQAGLDEVKVDSERFIDLKHMLQRRYDDVNKRRTIKRTETKKRSVATAAIGSSSAGRKKRRVGDNVQTSVAQNDSGVGAAAASSTSATSSVGPAAVGHLALPNVPDDWDSFDSLDYFEVNVDKGSNEFEWVSKIVQETTEDAHTMNDFNHKIKFRRLDIVKVMRVQNPSTWMAYNSFREQIISESKGCSPPVANGNLKPVATNVKEFFLFHGLNGGLYADKITRFGMDPRYSSVEGMFGAGLYFADLASKSNQYVHCGKCQLSGAMPRDPVARSKFVKNCKCKQSDVACALLCRVTLGDTLIEKNYRGNSPGQFWHARRREPEKPGGGIYNSVVGESRANGGSSLEFREYIVYESKQVYPEYKVYFRRAI